jgi:hypothetical protein
MTDSKTISGRKMIVVAALSIAGGIFGILIGIIFGSALQTTPIWIGPAIIVGTVALSVIGLLLLPTVVRAWRRKDFST